MTHQMKLEVIYWKVQFKGRTQVNLMWFAQIFSICILFEPHITTGCELYGTECRSWGGLKHEKCQVPESLSFSSSVVCTLPQFNLMNDSSACRNCTDLHKWRCDDGYCIDQRLHRDGIPDCADGSDEKPGKYYTFYLHLLWLVFRSTFIYKLLLVTLCIAVPLRMWRGVVITMAVTGVGICVSFFYRCFIGRVSQL